MISIFDCRVKLHIIVTIVPHHNIGINLIYSPYFRKIEYLCVFGPQRRSHQCGPGKKILETPDLEELFQKSIYSAKHIVKYKIEAWSSPMSKHFKVKLFT